MTNLTITIDTDKWAVVPKVPTEAMREAGIEERRKDRANINPYHVYAAMLAAAPRPEPVQQDGPVGYQIRSREEGSESDDDWCQWEYCSSKGYEYSLKNPVGQGYEFQVRKLFAEQPARRPAFYVDKQSWLSCTHKVAPCDIPVWCSDADVVMKLMLALHDVNTAPRPVPTSEWQPFAISADEMEAFDRFRETCEDDQDYDVPVVMMKRLAEIGLVRRVTRNIYETTAFGMAVASGRINIRDYQQGKSDGVAEMAAELKRLCKDFSDRQNRPYMADVHAAIDGLTEQLLEHAEPPTGLKRPPAPGEA